MADIKVFHETISGMVEGEAPVDGWQSYVRLEDHREAIAAEKARADAAEADCERWRLNSIANHEAFAAMRNAINEVVPMQSAEADLLQGPELSVSCEAIAAAVVATIASLTEQLAEARRALEPRGWFVKDDAYGWSHFDNEVDARLHSEATGGMILVGVLQIETSKTPTDRFAQWLNDGPKLAKAVGVYVGIKVSAQPYARATLSRLEKQEGEA